LDAFGTQGTAWLRTLPLRPVYQHALSGFLQVLEVLRAQIREASRLIDQEAKTMPIVGTLCTLPGVGHYTALLILAEIGDVNRFPDPKRLTSYAGLVPTVRASGGNVQTGRISKQGSAWLRWTLVEAAQHASRRPGRFQALYRRLAQRKGSKIARVAVARELLMTVCWMLRHA